MTLCASLTGKWRILLKDLKEWNLFDVFRIHNLRKLKDSLSKKCPEFGKLPISKECELLQTVVDIENWWYVFQQGVKCPKILKKEGWNFFWECEICMETVYKIMSKYLIITSIFMENQPISKAKMIIILWRPFVACGVYRVKFLPSLYFQLTCF